MASEPHITVVIPTRDRSALVCRALESVSSQRRAPAEVIVVDDASTDDTISAIERLGVAARILFCPGLGAAAARNTGVSAARSEWIAFLDSDDIWEPDHLAVLADAIVATDGEASLYFTDAELPAGATAFGRSAFAPATPVELLRPGARWALHSVQPMMTPAVVVSRTAYMACGGQDPELPCREDTHLFLLLALDAPTCAVSASTVRVTDDGRGNRLTAQLPGSDAAYWVATARLYADVLRRFPKLEPGYIRELQRRLATAHWRLGRLAWRRGRRAEAAGRAWRSARVDPTVMLRRVARRG